MPPTLPRATRACMKPAFELFDHTADIGIRARAASLPDLLLAAKDGLYAVIGDLASAGPAEPVAFDLTGDDAAGLLRDFLHELLILFERDGRVVTSLDVEAFDESHLRATGQADQVDPERSQFAREVKAITYHELDVRRIHAGFEATVIVDI